MSRVRRRRSGSVPVKNMPLTSAVGLVEEILSIPGGSLLNADIDDLTFFEKADSTASRGLSRDMTDVFALAGRVATVIFERAK